MKKSTQKTVLETILEWSGDRPMGQRDALGELSKMAALTTVALRMIALCRLGRGAKHVVIKPIALEDCHLPANPGETDAVSLVPLRK